MMRGARPRSVCPPHSLKQRAAGPLAPRATPWNGRPRHNWRYHAKVVVARGRADGLCGLRQEASKKLPASISSSEPASISTVTLSSSLPKGARVFYFRTQHSP